MGRGWGCSYGNSVEVGGSRAAGGIGHAVDGPGGVNCWKASCMSCSETALYDSKSSLSEEIAYSVCIGGGGKGMVGFGVSNGTGI